jgi:hypothetical protein
MFCENIVKVEKKTPLLFHFLSPILFSGLIFYMRCSFLTSTVPCKIVLKILGLLPPSYDTNDFDKDYRNMDYSSPYRGDSRDTSMTYPTGYIPVQNLTMYQNEVSK